MNQDPNEQNQAPQDPMAALAPQDNQVPMDQAPVTDSSPEELAQQLQDQVAQATQEATNTAQPTDVGSQQIVSDEQIAEGQTEVSPEPTPMAAPDTPPADMGPSVSPDLDAGMQSNQPDPAPQPGFGTDSTPAPEPTPMVPPATPMTPQAGGSENSKMPSKTSLMFGGGGLVLGIIIGIVVGMMF